MHRTEQVHPGVTGSRWFLTRDFGLVWWGQMVAQVGDGISKLALLWFVYAITGSPLKTTMIGLLQTIPPIVFGPLIGIMVDRFSKKVLLIGTDLVRAVVLGLIPCLIPVEAFTIDRLYLLVFVHAVASAIFGPALTASVPLLVARHEYTAANAMLQMTTSIGVIVGPTLSGIGIATMSSQEVLCINALTYVVSAVCFLVIRFAPSPSQHTRGAERGGTIRDFIEGLKFSLVTQRIVLLLIGAASLYTFATSAFSTLFPVFGKRLLDLGPIEVGYYWSAFGVGLLLVSLGLISLSAWTLQKRIRVMSASSFISGMALVGLVSTSSHFLAAVLMVVIGMGVGTLTPIAWGVLQEVAPSALLGRVLAIYNVGTMSAAIGGMTLFGWTTQHFGERPSVVGIGMGLFITALAAASVMRWLRRNGGSIVPAHQPQPASLA